MNRVNIHVYTTRSCNRFYGTCVAKSKCVKSAMTLSLYGLLGINQWSRLLFSMWSLIDEHERNPWKLQHANVKV